ncbi:hypothetical protein GCK32_017706, partial [Trichostrongylus colubriformis]
SNSLVDFDKPEGLLPIDEGSSQTLKIRSAISVLIPATFQCIGAIAGFWPLAKRNRKSFQIIHITFSALAVLQWMPSVHAVAIEINQTFVQIHEWYHMKASPALANQSSLYSFALREVIVATYALLASVFFFVAAVQRQYGLVLASTIIQIICLVALSQLLSPSRLSAVLVNSRVLTIDNSSYPVAQVKYVCWFLP